MTRRALVALLTMWCVSLTACTDSGPDDQGAAPVATEPRPTLSEARDTLTAALASLERVLHESIPREEWREARGGYQNGCEEETQGRFVAPHYVVAAQHLPEDAWPRIEQVLAHHGFRSLSAVPLSGGSAFVHFINDFGDDITVSSILPGGGQQGGSGFRGKTACHEGYVR